MFLDSVFSHLGLHAQVADESIDAIVVEVVELDVLALGGLDFDLDCLGFSFPCVRQNIDADGGEKPGLIDVDGDSDGLLALFLWGAK